MKVIRKPEPLEAIEWDGSTDTMGELIRLKPIYYSVYFNGDFLKITDEIYRVKREVKFGDVLVFTKDTVDVYSRNEFDKIYEVINE